jgi:hypothetical protein
MRKAIEKGEFYAIAVECFSGYSIGNIDDSTPTLFGTKEEEETENSDVVELYESQIKQKERDSEDPWSGKVLMVKWDCKAPSMELFDNGRFVYREDWKSMSGL